MFDKTRLQFHQGLVFRIFLICRFPVCLESLNFWTTDSISLAFLGLFAFYISSWIDITFFLKTGHFPPKCQLYWHKVVHCILSFKNVSCILVVTFFHSWYCLYFLYIYLVFSKKSSFHFLAFFLLFIFSLIIQLIFLYTC